MSPELLVVNSGQPKTVCWESGGQVSPAEVFASYWLLQ